MGQVANSRSQTQQEQPVTKLETPLGTMLVGNVNTILGRSIKQVQVGILKECPMVETSLGGIFRHISTIGVVNLLKCVHSVSYGSLWISTIEGVTKKPKWTQGPYKQNCIDWRLLLLQW